MIYISIYIYIFRFYLFYHLKNITFCMKHVAYDINYFKIYSYEYILLIIFTIFTYYKQLNDIVNETILRK